MKKTIVCTLISSMFTITCYNNSKILSSENLADVNDLNKVEFNEFVKKHDIKKYGDDYLFEGDIAFTEVDIKRIILSEKESNSQSVY